MTSHVARMLDEYPMDYPEAYVRLVDALRDFIRSDKSVGEDLLREGVITREQYERGQAELQPHRLLLQRLEAHGIDPSLYGVLRR